MATKFKTQFMHDRLKGIEFTEKSWTQPQFGYETDINNIVNGCITTLNNERYNLQYLDTTTVPSYEQALQILADANSQFECLPSELRARFNNDPKCLLEFVNNKSNYDEALKLGLINPRVDIDTSTPTQTAMAVTQPQAGGSGSVSEPSA